MKILLLLLFLFCTGSVSAQSDLDKMVETEHNFAQFASEKGTKAAFLAFLAKDGILFLPDRVNGNEYWNNRGESDGLLSGAPNYADISANGILGYTTGNWEYRSKGKGTTPEGFGEFITVWLRHPDGKYRFVVDIGIGHAKPAAFSSDWSKPSSESEDLNEARHSAADSANSFFASLSQNGVVKAYESHALDDVRAFREGVMPIIGKKEFIKYLRKEKGKYELSKRSTFFETADLAYNTNTYRRWVDGKIAEKGNAVQIWKRIDGKWRLVLDVFKPVP